MIFNPFKKLKIRYTKKQISTIGKGFYKLINPHLSNFQKIIKSVIDTYPKLHQYYNIDDNPNLDISESDFTVGCSLTFVDSCDTSNDACSNRLLDPSIIDKIFEMENKIIKELRYYCDKNELKVKFINNTHNWDDAGIFCSIDIGFFLNDMKTESVLFEGVKFVNGDDINATGSDYLESMARLS